MALMGWFVGVISVSQASMEDAVLSFTDRTGQSYQSQGKFAVN